MSSLKDINADVYQLILKFLIGNITKEEEQLIIRWVYQSEENRELFVKLKASWMATAKPKENNPVNTQKALTELNKKLGLEENNSSRRLFISYQFWKIAAILIIMFSVGSLVTYISMKKNSVVDKECSPIFVYTPKGSKAMTLLPDGTQVWLNAGSNISYDASSYGKLTRKVTLIGEGFFKVVSNAKVPFIVNAKYVSIKALGTEFDVKAYPEENIVETTLIRGIVDIEGNDKNKKPFKITMNPKQKVTVFAGVATLDTTILSNPSRKMILEELKNTKLVTISPNLPSKPIINDILKTDLITSWKDNRWVFEGETIGNLSILLERRYNVKINIASEELKLYKFTGTFENETIEQIMQVLQITAPLKYKIGKGIIDVKLDPNLKMKYKKYIN